MKVSELIVQLSKYPQDMNVFGYDADLSTGKGVVDIELCVTPVFIDTYDQSVWIAYDTDYDIGYGRSQDEVEERQGDTEVYDVLMVCNSKIDTNDLTHTNAEDQWLNDLKAIERDYDNDLRECDNNLKSTLIITDKESA